MHEKNPSYAKQMFTFYFAPIWQSFFRIFYLIFFSYFAIFHSGKIWVAIKFIFYTLWNSTALIGLSYLFWGVTFLISLIIPLSISLYAIPLLFKVWSEKNKLSNKFLATLVLVLGIPLIIILMDEVIRATINQPILREFVLLNDINVGR